LKIPIDQITPDPNQPRKTFKDEALQELRDSFTKLGLIQPITVRPYNGKYLIIVGERRYRATLLKGLTEIECIIREDVDDKTTREMQFAENYHMEPLTALEQAEAWVQHLEQYGMKQVEFARIVGVSPQTVYYNITLIKNLAKELLAKIPDGNLAKSHAEVIATIPNQQRQIETAQPILKGDIIGRKADEYLTQVKSQPTRPVTDIISDFLAGKIAIENLARAEAVKLASTIPLETPEDKERAARALLKEVKDERQKALSPEEREAKKTENEAKKQERTQKAEEKAGKMSLEEIHAIADKVAETDPGRAYQLKERLDKRLNRTERHNHQRQGISPVSLPEGKYRAIVIDPPWDIDKIAREERLDQYDFGYPSMTLDEIRSLPVQNLAAEDGCHIYLWTTHKHLPDALDILAAWDAKYQCLLTWVKNVGFTPFSFMYSTEHCLFARIGDLPLLKMGERLDFFAKVREHSRKPGEFYNLVRIVSPERRIDMFGREKREGFEVWGNEPAKFTQTAKVG